MKPLGELLPRILDCSSLLVVGCGGCTSLCYTGGLRETRDLKDIISRSAGRNKTKMRIHTRVVERQCEIEYIIDLDRIAGEVDAVISMGCGAGVQLLAERYESIPVYPALNTVFIGTSSAPGIFDERCRTCGDCQLAYTGGICPVTRCAKGIYNGPCGGSEEGRCEANPSVGCAWCSIYERLESQGRLDSILDVREPVLWKNQRQGSFKAWENYQDEENENDS